MPTVSENLVRIREKLHDPSGTFWSDDELVRWFNDAYEQFCSKTRCVTELYQMDLPPRYAYTHCYEWEDAFTSQGPSRMIMLPALNGVYRCTSAWEVEFIEGVAPTESLPGVTQLWEREYMDTDRHYQVTLPQNHEIIQAVRFDNRILYPLVTSELDEMGSQWYRQGTQPHWWTNGTGRVNTVEIYEIQTEYQQAYAPLDYEDYGFARTFNGSRTYTVDSSASNSYAYCSSGDGQALDLAGSALLTGLGWRFTRASTEPTKLRFATHTWEEELSKAPPHSPAPLAMSVRTTGNTRCSTRRYPCLVWAPSAPSNQPTVNTGHKTRRTVPLTTAVSDSSSPVKTP